MKCLQVEFLVGHVLVATGLAGHGFQKVQLLAGSTAGGDQRRTTADGRGSSQVGRRTARHLATDRRGKAGASIQRRAQAHQEPEDGRGLPVAATGAQDRAGGAQQDVPGRNQALHNPGPQGQRPDLIARRSLAAGRR